MKKENQRQRDAESDRDLSPSIAVHEQLLFYIAAVAGPTILGFAVGGWLVLKSVNKYARWEKPQEPGPEPENEAGRPAWCESVLRYYREAATAHNSFQIFAIGTALSIAAGGLAGVSYHYALYYLATHPGCL
jgi:hypothetical protein